MRMRKISYAGPPPDRDAEQVADVPGDLPVFQDLGQEDEVLHGPPEAVDLVHD
jgi:hypothetical protein